MPGTTPLDILPLSVLIAVLAGLILASIETGYRLGRYRRQIADDEREAPVGTIIGATLGLLGFLLAFTFGLAASRFEARRQVLVDEANAIGTAYLRAGLLTPEQARISRGLLKAYVQSRLDAISTRDTAAALSRATTLHEQLWNVAEAAGRDAPESIVVGLYVDSLNDVIDVHSRRVLVGLQSRLPGALWVTLILVTVLTMGGVGYHEGLSKSRRSPAVAVLILTFASVMSLIADLDRPQEGALRVNQQALQDLNTQFERRP